MISFIHYEMKISAVHSSSSIIMAFVERQASSSQPKPKRRGKSAPKVKTNVAKREKFNDEIKELQRRIDELVSVLEGIADVRTREISPPSTSSLYPRVRSKD